MNKILLILLHLVFVAHAQQQKRIAIIQTMDDGEPTIEFLELSHLTDRLREIARKTLPPKSYAIMTQQSILAYLGSMDRMEKECKESEGCIAKLGRKINADYICQARIGRFGKDLTIKAELYESKSGDLISSFTGKSKDIYGLLSVLDKESPEMFKRIEDKTPPPANTPAPANTPIAQPKPIKETPSIPPPPPTSTPISGNTLLDSRDGKTYRTVKIGSQIWMAENMNYDAKGSKCYKNNPNNCTKYGRMYNWETAMKACPSGWHLPSNDEWDVLHNYAGGSYAGIKLKARSGWYSCGASNSSHYPYCEDTYGFSALPGGYGYLDGSFDFADTSGHWWSASEGEGSSTSAHNRNMRYYDRGISGSINDKEHLLSVRCVRDNGKNDRNSGSGSTGKKAKGSLNAPNARDIDMDNENSRSKAEILAVVNARISGLRNIYNKYLKFKPDFSGNVTLKFTIAPGGDIIKISILSSTTDHANFDNAVKNMVATWKWKAIKSGNTTVTMPLDFE